MKMTSICRILTIFADDNGVLLLCSLKKIMIINGLCVDYGSRFCP